VIPTAYKLAVRHQNGTKSFHIATEVACWEHAAALARRAYPGAVAVLTLVQSAGKSA
jgi:hypothetical protein